jgi:hypothetical protein
VRELQRSDNNGLCDTLNRAFQTGGNMVYLVLTSQGLKEILNTPEAAKMPMWCGANVLSESEYVKLQRNNVTRFTYSFANCDNATIQRALSTIEEHHPGERIRVEGVVFED